MRLLTSFMRPEAMHVAGSTRDRLTSCRRGVRDRFRRSINGLPEPAGERYPVETGVLARDGHRIRETVHASQPARGACRRPQRRPPRYLRGHARRRTRPSQKHSRPAITLYPQVRNLASTHTATSYYGLSYVEHAAADFQEMKTHGCTTVILAITEFDFDFWRPNIPKIVAKAHELGLRVLLDPWGIGKYFGGEQVSLFLQNNTENRQVSALTGEKLPYACFNTNSFRDYFQRICLALARE